MRYSKNRYLGLPVASAVLFTLGVLLLSLALPPGPSWIKGVLICTITVGALGLNLLAYRHADEVILASHKTAWFWGCWAAIAGSIPVIIGIAWSLIPAPAFFPADPKIAFAEGVAFLIILQSISFAIVKLIWNRR